MEVPMEIGMLWFDNDKKSDYEAKIERAATYYRDKYGKAPNLCFVHPCMIPENGNPTSDKFNLDTEPPSLQSQGVEIRTSKTMLPNHFWIGINRQETTSAL
jgi:hypothetical protein